LKDVPFAVSLWKVENLYYQMSRTTYPELVGSGTASAEWSEDFLKLGGELRIRVEPAKVIPEPQSVAAD